MVYGHIMYQKRAASPSIHYESIPWLTLHFRAVNHLTSIQAVALAPKHVTVNAILPGVFPSKMTAHGINKFGEQMARAQPTGASPLSMSFHSGRNLT